MQPKSVPSVRYESLVSELGLSYRPVPVQHGESYYTSIVLEDPMLQELLEVGDRKVERYTYLSNCPFSSDLFLPIFQALHDLLKQVVRSKGTQNLLRDLSHDAFQDYVEAALEV